jgi:hypothetical protein
MPDSILELQKMHKCCTAPLSKAIKLDEGTIVCRCRNEELMTSN